MKEIPKEGKGLQYTTLLTNYVFNATTMSWGPTELGNSLY